jgi:hypothetical protein
VLVAFPGGDEVEFVEGPVEGFGEGQAPDLLYVKICVCVCECERESVCGLCELVGGGGGVRTL